MPEPTLSATVLSLVLCGLATQPATNASSASADAATRALPSLASALDAAAAPAAEEDDTLVWSWKNGLRVETADKRYRFRIGGRVQFDAGWFAGDEVKGAGIPLEDGSEFRRARLYMSGEFPGGSFFKAEYEFAGSISDSDNRPGLTDVLIGQKDLLAGADVQAGHFKEPFGLEQLTGANYLTFLERSVADALVPGRNDGVMVSGTLGEEQATWAAGVFRADTDNAGNSVGDGGYAGTARVTWAPVYRDDGATLVHLGVDYSKRDMEGARFRSRPEAHLLGNFIDTGALDNNDVDLAGGELACVLGPFSLQGEYVQASTTGDVEADLIGWYAEASWFLTGEHREYERAKGAFGRVSPKHPTSGGGHGAWQLAVRASNLDLGDSAVDAGTLDCLMLGVNWYLNPNLRAQVNCGRANVDDPSAGLDDAASMLMFRLQADW